jgi:hypothetical protein
MPPASPPPAAAPPPASEPKRKGSSNWDALKSRANTIASIAALFVFLVAVGGVVGYFYSQSKKEKPADKTPTVQTLSPEDLNKLTQIGANLGASGQTLNIGANALFRGKADVTGDLSIGGRLNANGPVTLSQLNITGNTAATGLNVGSNLIVGGTTTLQRTLTVNDLTTINSNLNVSGTIGAGAINASSIAVRNITITGALTIAHFVTQGSVPAIAAGSVGAGGTVSISGNDTAGQVNINTGGGPGNALATVTFRAAYGATVHVQLSPITSAAASSGAYVTRTNTGFQIHANSPASGAVLSFDYLVTQ